MKDQKRRVKMQPLYSILCLCTVSALLGKVQALERPQQSTWFDIFSPDGSISKEKLEKFPLYEYGFQDYEYGAQIWSDCSDSSYPIQIQSVYVNPSPPQRGNSFTVSTAVTLSEQVNSGYVKILIKYSYFVPVVSKTMKICEMVNYLGISCPISAGTQELSTTQSFPSYAPSGKYTGKVIAQDGNGNPLLCVNIDMAVK